MYDNIYGQSNSNTSSSMNQSDRKLTRKDLLLYIIVPVVVALISTGAFFGVKGNTPTPQPVNQQSVNQQPSSQQATIPQLHNSYSGSAINNNNPLDFSLSGLVEQSDGTFTSSGTMGSCNIVVSGNVSGTGIITFTAQQQQDSNDFNCPQLSGDFTGKVTNNGDNLSGQWSTENISPTEGGTWELS